VNDRGDGQWFLFEQTSDSLLDGLRPGQGFGVNSEEIQNVTGCKEITYFEYLNIL
jgi:hypothetical protein